MKSLLRIMLANAENKDFTALKTNYKTLVDMLEPHYTSYIALENALSKLTKKPIFPRVNYLKPALEVMLERNEPHKILEQYGNLKKIMQSGKFEGHS